MSKFVISVNGVFKGKKNFYYVSESSDSTGYRFSYDSKDAIVFPSLTEALIFAKENYMALLTAMANNSAKIVTKSLAVREVVVIQKYIPAHDIDENILNFGVTWDLSEVENEEKDTNAQHEGSDNVAESESGMADEMSTDAV